MFRGPADSLNVKNYYLDEDESKTACLGISSAVSGISSAGIASAAGAGQTASIVSCVTGTLAPLFCVGLFATYRYTCDRINQPEDDPLVLTNTDNKPSVG